MQVSPILLTNTTIVAQNPEPLSSAIDSETILMFPRKDCYIGMNKVSSVVWNRLEKPVMVGDLISSLQNDYEGVPERISADVMALLNEMAELDLLIISEP